MPRRCLIALACLGMLACSVPGRPTAAATTQQTGPVACPDGKPDRAGLSNFGAYIGTWATAHRRDPQASDAYAIGTLPGHVTVRCSAHDFVIAEAISPRNQVPAGLALRVALSDLPDDDRPGPPTTRCLSETCASAVLWSKAFRTGPRRLARSASKDPQGRPTAFICRKEVDRESRCPRCEPPMHARGRSRPERSPRDSASAARSRRGRRPRWSLESPGSTSAPTPM